MQLETKGHTTEMGGMIKDPAAFKIQNSAAAFKILSSGLYADKVTAVIREIVCNAFDIHVSTGQKRPFKIHLPTSLEPFFLVQDFGTGLAPEDMEELYVTYFASTKADDDMNIGGFGLGCKSPFAYCSAFNVTSVFDGTEYTYSLMLNEDGLPSIVLMDEQATEDHSGLTVSMPVKTYDSSEFHNKAARVLEFFEGCYETNLKENFRARKVEHTHKGENWAIRKILSEVGAAPRAMVGNVAYAFNQSSLTNLTDEQSMVLRLPIDLFFNVGELTVTPSRESLEMTKRTISNLCARLQVIYDQVVLSLKEEIENAPSLWKAKVLLRERMQSSNPFSPIIKKVIKGYFKQAGFDVDEVSTSLDRMSVKRFQIYSRQWEPARYGTETKIGKLYNFMTNYKMIFETSDRVKFYVKDTDENLGRLTKRILEMYKNEENEKIVLYILIPEENSKATSKEFSKIISGLGDPDVLFTSDLPPVPKKPRGVRTYSDMANNCWKAMGLTYNINTIPRAAWEKVQKVALEEDIFFYVPLENLQLLGHVQDGVIARAWVALQGLEQTCEIEGEEYEFKNLSLWGLNAKGVEKVSKDSRWVNFLTYIKDFKFDAPEEYLRYKAMKAVGVSGQSGNPELLEDYIRVMFSNPKDEPRAIWAKPFRKLISKTDFHKQAIIQRRLYTLLLRDSRDRNDYRYWDALYTATTPILDFSPYIPDYIKAYKVKLDPKVFSKYPLLPFLDFDWNARRSEEFGTLVGEYIANIG